MKVFQFSIICKRTNNANNATHYVELGKKRRESSKRNYYILSQRVIIKASILIRRALNITSSGFLRAYFPFFNEPYLLLCRWFCYYCKPGKKLISTKFEGMTDPKGRGGLFPGIVNWIDWQWGGLVFGIYNCRFLKQKFEPKIPWSNLLSFYWHLRCEYMYK